MNILVQLYRNIVPDNIRKFIYKIFLGDLLLILRNPREGLKAKWYKIYYLFCAPQNEKEKAFKIWSKIGPTMYPYLWKKEYDLQHYKVNINGDGLPYIIHNGKRLYFKRNLENPVEDTYRSLLIEQDERSAHRYVRSNEELMGKILLDVGAAEGIFALDVIDYVDHVYLFECDQEWIEALQATFMPWRDKVTIVQKYVSDKDDESNVTLDKFFVQKESVDNLFIKMDIEGYERFALRGSVNVLKRSKGVSGSICIYHLQDDQLLIGSFLSDLGMINEVVDGYLYIDGEMRSGIIRFHK